MLLRELAYARSGDKGAHANIAVIAYTQEGYQLIEKALTEERVASFFSRLQPQGVKRYLLPKLLAMNFILYGVLEGGGSRCLRVDAQGKALGQALLMCELENICR